MAQHQPCAQGQLLPGEGLPPHPDRPADRPCGSARVGGGRPARALEAKKVCVCVRVIVWCVPARNRPDLGGGRAAENIVGTCSATGSQASVGFHCLGRFGRLFELCLSERNRRAL
eukprot:6996959-Alexandrium_andersonii.AAC.1